MRQTNNRSDLLAITKRLLLDSAVIVGVLGFVLLADNLFKLTSFVSNGTALVRQYELFSHLESVAQHVALAFTAVFLTLEMLPVAMRIWKQIRKPTDNKARRNDGA